MCLSYHEDVLTFGTKSKIELIHLYPPFVQNPDFYSDGNLYIAPEHIVELKELIEGASDCPIEGFAQVYGSDYKCLVGDRSSILGWLVQTIGPYTRLYRV